MTGRDLRIVTGADHRPAGMQAGRRGDRPGTDVPRDDGFIAGRLSRPLRDPSAAARGRAGDRHLRVLLLAGTADARQIASALIREPGVQTRAALARAERRPIPLGVPIRIGGWGGRAAFADWLVREGIGAVIDATHPFAARMSHRAAEVADDLGIEYIRFLRPAWRPGEGDRWIFLSSPAAAAGHIAPDARVFLVTGRPALADFASLEGRTVFCRTTDSAPDRFPFSEGRFLGGVPPFAVEDEIATLADLGIDWLVVHNTGGTEGHAKLDAARALGIPVAMLRRPAPPEGVIRCETLSEVMAWVRRRV